MTTKVYAVGRSSNTKYSLGARSSRVAGRCQNYEEIKRKCLKEGILFEDPEFPAVEDSLFFSKKPPRPFVWKRPSEICSDPQLIVGGATRFDITQGMLGDCWLLASIASLSINQDLVTRVVPHDQSFTNDYCGLFRFRLWRQGDWIDVVVDDRLPTYNNKLVFLHSATGNEFWSALLEKAYAKLNGSYEALKGGQTSEAMEDFTGGVTETFDMKKAPNNFMKIMMQAFARSSLMGCSIEAKPNEIEAKLDNGLIKGHAYTITAVKQVDVRGKKADLVRIRNPWGNEREWTGAWSDESKEWRYITDDEKKRIGLSFDDDGEFWMSLEDFMRNFTKVEICMLSPDSAAGDGGEKKQWSAITEHARWTKGVSAGGCRNFPDTFAKNPQFFVKLTDFDDDGVDDNCTLVIGVMQKGRRILKRIGGQNLTIGFSIYELPDDFNRDRLDKDYFLYHKSTARSANFVNAREVTGRFSLPAGNYVVIPSTFKSDEEGSFLIRMFTEKQTESGAIDETTGITNKEQSEPTVQDDQRDAKFMQFFQKIAGKDEEIDAYELNQVLNSMFKEEGGFGLDACQSMVAMLDGDVSGMLGIDEFKLLLSYIRNWKTAFDAYDADKSGNLMVQELRAALNDCGIRVSYRTLGCLAMRYRNKNGSVPFPSFVSCVSRLNTMIESFNDNDSGQYGMATYSMDEFIQTTMYS